VPPQGGMGRPYPDNQPAVAGSLSHAGRRQPQPKRERQYLRCNDVFCSRIDRARRRRLTSAFLAICRVRRAGRALSALGRPVRRRQIIVDRARFRRPSARARLLRV
jgi:hypothetical protein